MVAVILLTSILHFKYFVAFYHKMENMNRYEDGVKRGAWSKEEDILLRNCINKFGVGRWHLVPLRAGLNRCRRSCRMRWLNYLSPDVKRGHFSQDEVDLLIRLHKLLGNRWSLIAGRLPGRTANDVKNFWNSHICKKPPSTGDKRRRKMITESNIIRPRPRTLSKSQLSALSSKLTGSKPLRNDDGGQAPTMKHASMPPSSSSSLSLEKANDRDENIPMINALLEDDIDECLRWWGNLLEMAEGGGEEQTPLWITGDEQGMTAPAFVEEHGSNGANYEGLEFGL